MCGIIGYTGRKNATPILLDGLRALEYRGYDSAGLYVCRGGCIKAVGPVEALSVRVPENFGGTAGIAHTRWATHGVPSEKNSHPHEGGEGTVWIVHNGIIENYKELKEKLIARGINFKSDTDTEVVAHLVALALKKEKFLERAVISALREVRGTYGLAIASATEPEKIVVARMGSPLVIGLGDGERFVASDPAPILRHTKTMVYLEDGEVAVLTPDSHSIMTLNQEPIARPHHVIDWDREAAEKAGFSHFMEKEMTEVPEVIKNTLRGRLVLEDGLARLGGLTAVADRLRDIRRLIIVACGTAYYAGLVGEYMIEEYAGIPVEVEIGSEFRYRKPIFDENTALLAISQSGETADTLEAIREAKRKGALTLGIVNVVGSTIARETDAGVYNHAGPEIGVASTKALVSQLIVLALLTIFLGRQRNMSRATGKRIAEELLALPEKAAKIISRRLEIEKLAKNYAESKGVFYIGRKYNFPIALEGALKLKEISYIHAEGYGAGELKHGPLALIDESFPTVAVAPHDSVYDKMVSNIMEVKARSGRVLALGTEGDENLESVADDVFLVPKTLEMLSPILFVLPLQWFAYYIAREKGASIDKPRNLAKSVTVE